MRGDSTTRDAAFGGARRRDVTMRGDSATRDAASGGARRRDAGCYVVTQRMWRDVTSWSS